MPRIRKNPQVRSREKGRKGRLDGSEWVEREGIIRIQTTMYNQMNA